MKRFIIKTSLFVVIICLINLVLHSLVPYHWGNEPFSCKLDYYEEHESKYNTVFFGSSRTYRQVNTGQFDSLVNTHGFETSSYNFGAQATFNPQVYFLYENFLEDHGDDIDVAFVELMVVDEIPGEILHTTRNKYWINPEYYSFAMQHFFFLREWDELWNYTVSFLEDFFNANQVIEIITSIVSGKERIAEWSGDHNGFLPIDREIALHPDDQGAIDLKIRHERYLNQFPKLKERRARADKAFATDESYPYISRIHLEKLKQMIRKSEEKGVRLIFFVADITSAERLVATYLNLPEKNRIELISPEGSAYNYDPALRWDLGHLNKEGAKLFTRQLAEKYAGLPVR